MGGVSRFFGLMVSKAHGVCTYITCKTGLHRFPNKHPLRQTVGYTHNFAKHFKSINKVRTVIYDKDS